MRLKAIALNTFKEAVRNKVFYLLVVLGIVTALSSIIISMLTIGDKVKVLKDFGLAAIEFFCVLIAIFTGINLVFKEIDKKTGTSRIKGHFGENTEADEKLYINAVSGKVNVGSN